MMFVALIPTAAFAGGLPVDDPLLTVAQYKKHIENMIKNTKTNVEKSYNTLMGDRIVYTSAKAMDDSVVSLVDAIADPLIEKGKANKAWADACKDAIRFYLDETVSDKIAEELLKGKHLDKDGKWDNLKYAEVVSKAMNDALTDKKFIAGYQAVATNFALRALVSDMSDAIKDEYDDFRENTVDPSFEKKFAEKYTNLVDDYIDTLATADAKIVNNALVDLIYTKAVADANAAYEAIHAPAQLAYDKAADIAALDYSVDKANADKTYEQDLKNAEDAYKIDLEHAEQWYAAGTHGITSEYDRDLYKIKAEYWYKEKVMNAETKYNNRLDQIQGFYDGKIDAAEDAYDTAMGTSEEDLAKALLEAGIAHDANIEYINPWAQYMLPGVGSWN
jgi:ketosteroid isomerase-like protein